MTDMARAKKKTPAPRTRSPKALRPPREVSLSPQAKRRQKSAEVSVRKDTMLSQMQPPHGDIPGVKKRKSRGF